MAKAACEARCAALFRLCATQASDSGCGACIVGYAGALSDEIACVREEASGSSNSSGGGAGTSSSIAVEVTLGLGCGVLFFFLVVSMARRGWFTWCTRLRRTQQYRGYFQSTSPRWQCSVCLHDNSAVHKQCVLCASDSPELTITIEQSAGNADLSGEENAFHLIETPKTQANHDRNSSSRTQWNHLQQSALDRHGWKRLVDHEKIRWIRVTEEELRSNYDVLRGTFVSVKMLRMSSILLSNNILSRRASTGESPSVQSNPFVREEAPSISKWRAVDDVVISSSTYPQLAELQRVSRLPFEEKSLWFYRESANISASALEGYYTIRVHREHVLKQSMQLFLTAPSTTLRRHLRVDFMEEPGVDGGGILREWLHLVCSSLFSDALGVFEPVNSSIHQGYWINRNAALRCRSHLQMLSFAGKLLGKALLEGMIINVQLSIPLLKHLLGVPFSLTDLRYVDEQIYSSLVYLLKNDEVEQLGLTFAVAGHELIPDGANVAVTDVNKQRYVDRLVKYYLFDSVERELKCFTEGVRSVIPGNILHVFDYRELDLLISGLAEIDVADWKEHTDVRLLDQDLGRELQIIEWFWDIIGAMSQIERSRLLQYVTGCGGLPVEGFAGLTGLDGLLQPFTIQLTDTASNSYTMLPYASTCVNRLDIPMYSSRDEMEEMLHMVIQMDVTGFNRQ